MVGTFPGLNCAPPRAAGTSLCDGTQPGFVKTLFRPHLTLATGFMSTGAETTPSRREPFTFRTSPTSDSIASERARSPKQLLPLAHCATLKQSSITDAVGGSVCGKTTATLFRRQ